MATESNFALAPYERLPHKYVGHPASYHAIHTFLVEENKDDLSVRGTPECCDT